MSTWAGNGELGFGEGPQLTTPVEDPHQMALDGDGVMYVAAQDRSRILQIKNGMVSLLAGNDVAKQIDGVGAAASFSTPHGLAVALVGGRLNVFVAEPYEYFVSESNWRPGRVIRRITSSSGGWQVATLRPAASESDPLDSPCGLATDPATQTIYISNCGGHCISKLVLGGDPQFPATVGTCDSFGYVDGPALEAKFCQPQGVTVRGQTMFVADSYNHCIREVAAGQVRTIAGTCGTPGESDEPARFRYPGTIVVDSAGVLYVSEVDNHCIRKLVEDAASGKWQVSTIAGACGEATDGYVDGLGHDARFSSVCGLAMSKEGDLYAADPGNNVIRRLAR